MNSSNSQKTQSERSKTISASVDGFTIIRSEITGLDIHCATGDSGAKYSVCRKTGSYVRAAGVSLGFGANPEICVCESGSMQIPAGAAHFLEHVLFKKNNRNIADEISNRGASANAETGQTATSFFFDCTSQFDDNLASLLDIIADDTLDDASIEAERGIILAEFLQYQDNPYVKAQAVLRRMMYGEGNVATDISGTRESITGMTRRNLLEIRNAFYRAPNMHFVSVGDIDPEVFISTVENRIASLPKGAVPEKRYSISLAPLEHLATYTDNVSRPLLGLGIRFSLPPLEDDIERRKMTHAVSMGMEIVFGDSSRFVTEMINSGLADDSLSFVLSADWPAPYILMGSNTGKPIELSRELRKRLTSLADGERVDESELNIEKRRIIGQAVFSTSTIPAIHGGLLYPPIGEFPPKKLNEELIAAITIEDVRTALSRALTEFELVELTVIPREE